MPKFNINKLRSAGRRYLIADADGQMWAYEAMPVRKDLHWRLADEHLCPEMPGGGYNLQYWTRVSLWEKQGRKLSMPIYDAPIKLTFEDEPYDIVKHRLVAEKDFKVWPKF